MTLQESRQKVFEDNT